MIVCPALGLTQANETAYRKSLLDSKPERFNSSAQERGIYAASPGDFAIAAGESSEAA